MRGFVRILTVNIYRTAGESWQTFKYITDSSCNFGFFEAEAARVVGASMMWGISGRLRKEVRHPRRCQRGAQQGCRPPGWTL